MPLNEQRIRELIGRPKNGSILSAAREEEKELKQLFNDEYKEDVIFSKVAKILTPEKAKAFKNVYQNHSKPIVDKILTHMSKVYESYGRVINYDFGNNISAEVQFEKAVVPRIYSGVSDDDYWRNIGHGIAIREPMSVFVTGLVVDQDETGEVTDQSIQVKHWPLSCIHDMDATPEGIEYLILKIKGEGGNEYQYWAYDSVSIYVFREGKGGLVLEKNFEHGMGKTPCHRAYNKITRSELTHSESILAQVKEDLIWYSIMATFLKHNKIFSNYGTSVRPQTRCDYHDDSHGLICVNGILASDGTGNSTLPPGFAEPGGNLCPKCNKGKGAIGEEVEIPIAMQKDDFAKVLKDLYFRVEPSTDILKFNTEDMENWKNEILENVIGKGFGFQFKKQAVNKDQIGANFDDQESNLNEFGERIAHVRKHQLDCAATLFSPSFTESIFKLGKTHFLKPIEQLYSEQKQILETTSNYSMIQQKGLEIVLAENKNDPSKIDRWKLMSILRPFGTFPPDHIEKNFDKLSALFPGELAFYYRFPEVLELFEAEYGPIQTFAVNADRDKAELTMDSKVLQINKISAKLLQLYNSIKQKYSNGSSEGEPPEPGNE